jgi:hypothetical protein
MMGERLLANLCGDNALELWVLINCLNAAVSQCIDSLLGDFQYDGRKIAC